MAEPTFSNSAVGPVVGFIIGVVLMLAGNPLLGLFGGVLVFGSGLLFLIRLVALLSSIGERKGPSDKG